MKVVATYNPVRDIQAVEQHGYLDLTAANAAGSVPSNLQGSEGLSNGIEDPNSIGARPRDIFEANQAARAISDYVPPKKDKE